MATYKAIVTEKASKERVTIESEYSTKAEFIADLRSNGYTVNLIMVKTKEVFDYIINNTNCYSWDWKEINKIPAI